MASVDQILSDLVKNIKNSEITLKTSLPIELLNLFKSSPDNYYSIIHKLQESLSENPNPDIEKSPNTQTIPRLSTEYNELLSQKTRLENSRHEIQYLKADTSEFEQIKHRYFTELDQITDKAREKVNKSIDPLTIDFTSELRSFANPPPAVRIVCEALSYIFVMPKE